MHEAELSSKIGKSGTDMLGDLSSITDRVSRISQVSSHNRKKGKVNLNTIFRDSDLASQEELKVSYTNADAKQPGAKAKKRVNKTRLWLKKK